MVSSTENFNTPVCNKSPRLTHGALFAAYGGGSGGGGGAGEAGGAGRVEAEGAGEADEVAGALADGDGHG
jgi:hypothetical protein